MPLRSSAVFLALLSSSSAFIGINLGNVLEAPHEGDWAPAAQEYYFDDYVRANFTRVRIPVRWDQHLGTAPPYAIDPPFLTRVQTVVGWCLARNLTCVVNTHHDDWIGSAPNASFPAALPRFVALWTALGAAFAAAPPALLFEVINEPVAPLSLDNLNALYAAVLPAVRATNPTRTVYLGGLSWMSPYWIEKNPDAVVFPPLADGRADANLALEVHSYDPYAFCLQSPPTATSWGSPADVAAVDAMFAAAGAWGAARGRRVFMGEAGCQIAAARAGRLAWYRAVGRAAGALEGITVWDDDGTWKLYDRVARTWDAGVLDALFGR